jgi:uncharacterized repeat protein (TIGR01451 family)
MILQVPPFMHYLYYDVQFFSAEYPEYVNKGYNDALTVTVNSPSCGITRYVIDVNSGDFVFDSNRIPGTGFDIFATSGYPRLVDWVSTTPRSHGADAGATALVTRENPVSPYEQITVTFSITDAGDNQFDSGAFIDNVVFSGYERTTVIARKTLQDLNGEQLECGDTIRYTITISNTGRADQRNNPGHEFEDGIPANASYVLGSATATSGTITYDGGTNKLAWDGTIASESSVALTFNVTVNEELFNGALVSNQGTVYWDSNEDGTNDATELTDDPAVDDGIDQDGDGDTKDDDPTIITVTAYEAPSQLTEDFSDDTPGGNATQFYYTHRWFETSGGTTIGSNFEVASIYHYSTSQSFKIQLRASGGPQHWNYHFSQFGRDIQSWEAWFACGNASEPADLLLTFVNSGASDIARIKFEYVSEGTDLPTDYVLTLYYWEPFAGWIQLTADHPGGYLYNGWYKLRIAKNGTSLIDYSLYQQGKGLVNLSTGGRLGSPFEGLATLWWRSTLNPVVCPMFFWDEHTIGLTIP